MPAVSRIKIELSAEPELLQVVSASRNGYFQDLYEGVTSQIPVEVCVRVDELLRVPTGESLFTCELLKADAANAGIKNMSDEIAKLRLLRSAGVPASPFAALPIKVLKLLKRRVSNEKASEMREHPDPIRYALIGCFLHVRTQICYDANWYDNWRRLSDAGAKIVFWPSFFAGGMMLNSLAWMNKFYVVSSILNGDPAKMVYPLGEDIVATGRAANWVCAPLNLDFAVVQTVDNLRMVQDLSKKYGRAFRIRILHVEALALIEGVSAEISVA